MGDVRRQVRIFPKSEHFVMWEKRPIGWEVTAVIDHAGETRRHYPLTEKRMQQTVDALMRMASWAERNR